MTIEPLSLPQRLYRQSAPWLLALAAAVFASAYATGQASASLGKRPAFLLLAVAVGATILILFTFLGSAALLIWPVAATGGYLLGIPHGHPVITFDRAWIGGLVAYIAVTPRPIARSRTTRLVAFFLVWFVVSFGLRALATSTSLSGPLEVWADAILLPAVLFVACERYVIRGAHHGRRLAGALMVAGGVLGAIGLAERLFGFELATVRGGSVRTDSAIDVTRISGPYPAPETYALALAVCLAASLYWLLSKKRGGRYWPALLLIALEVTGIALTFFRAAWIAGILVLVAAIGIRPGRFGRTFVIVVVAAAIALAATSALQKNKAITQRVNNTQTIQTRFKLWGQGLDFFRWHPIFGIGVNRFIGEQAQMGPIDRNYGAHSSYLELLAEQGVVGFLPFALLSFAVFGMVRTLRRLSFRSKEALRLVGPVAGACLAYLVMSLTLTMLLYEPSNMFFAALAGLAAGRVDGLATDGRPEPA